MSLKVTRPTADAGDGEARRSAAPASKHSIQQTGAGRRSPFNA
jgi:hypothetical protein